MELLPKKKIIHKDVTKVEYSIYFEEKNLTRIPRKLPKRIMDITFWGDRTKTSVEKELRKDYISLKESILYELENVILTKNALYCKNYRHLLNKDKKIDLLLSGKNRSLDSAVLAHNYFSTRYWGHWIMSELPMQFFLREEGPFIGNNNRKPFRDEIYWRRKLKLPHIEKSEIWNIKRLTMTDPVVLEPLIIRSWLKIRREVTSEKQKSRLVYIKRGNTGQERVLVNEDEYIRSLETIGFEIIDIQNIRGDQIIETLSTAAVVVGVEGSHMDPVLYTVGTGCILIILQPPCRVSLNTVTNSSICGVASSIYICEPDGENSFYKFKINIKDFMRFYSNVQIWAEKNAEQFATRVNNLEEKFSKN